MPVMMNIKNTITAKTINISNMVIFLSILDLRLLEGSVLHRLFLQQEHPQIRYQQCN